MSSTRSDDVWAKRRAHLQTLSDEELRACAEGPCVVPLDEQMAELASSVLYQRENA